MSDPAWDLPSSSRAGRPGTSPCGERGQRGHPRKKVECTGTKEGTRSGTGLLCLPRWGEGEFLGGPGPCPSVWEFGWHRHSPGSRPCVTPRPPNDHPSPPRVPSRAGPWDSSRGSPIAPLRQDTFRGVASRTVGALCLDYTWNGGGGRHTGTLLFPVLGLSSYDTFFGPPRDLWVSQVEPQSSHPPKPFRSRVSSPPG